MTSTLIIDADDTLWENNIHFEEATERFLDIVELRGGEREPARDRLTQIETDSHLQIAISIPRTQPREA